METKERVRINTAIISVYDKTGIRHFASELVKINPKIRIISSGGTFREIENADPENSVEVSKYTGFPEMPSGLVKTLHPKIHGGILGNEPEDSFMKSQGIERIDLVVVNLYPFKKASSEKGSTAESARTNIDIGGVSLIEAGCKNFLRVAVITEPLDYEKTLDMLRRNNGCTDLETRLELCKKGFEKLSRYLTDISDYFSKLNAEGIREKQGG